MISSSLIHKLLEEFMADKDLFLVELKIAADNSINIYIDGDNGVNFDTCAALSRHVNENLDREVEDFQLEVSSAGLSLPFRVLRQYTKHIGKTVAVTDLQGKKYEGELHSANDTQFVLEYEQKMLVEGKKRKQLVSLQKEFAYDEIKATVLVLNF